MISTELAGGVVHELPEDLREALAGNAAGLAAWQDITPLARNEFLCWVEDARQPATRQRRIRRTQRSWRRAGAGPAAGTASAPAGRTGQARTANCPASIRERAT